MQPQPLHSTLSHTGQTLSLTLLPVGQASSAASLARQLRAFRWCPVLPTPPSSILPYPPPLSLPIATPPQCRPAESSPYTSARFFTLQHHVTSHSLLQQMGWSAPLTAGILAGQLAAVGRANVSVQDTDARQQLAVVATQLYTRLSALPESYADVAGQLTDSPCVWVGHGFAPPSQVALEGPLDLAPYLYVIPRELTPFQSFLLGIGVQARFTPRQYAGLLTGLKEAAG